MWEVVIGMLIGIGGLSFIFSCYAISIFIKGLREQDKNRLKAIQDDCVHHWEYQREKEYWKCCDCNKIEL